jgi:hypothetical protein
LPPEACRTTVRSSPTSGRWADPPMFLSVRSRRVPSLGLDNGGEPGEAAAALAVRHHHRE